MIPHNRPTIGRKEIEAACKVMESANLAQGREVKAFEDEMCDYLKLGHGHAVALSSGSAALYMAIRAKDTAGIFTDVAIPAYSCSALRNAVLMAGKSPVYVDVDEESPNMDLKSKKAENAGLVIACHIYGIPMRIPNKDVIEDCAQAIGACIDGELVGTQTEIGVFSFYATKPMTSAGEGGMVVSKNKSVIDYIKDLRDFDMKNDDRLRFNLKMTDLQAAVGRVQLRRLGEFISRRRYLADRYEKNGIVLWRKWGGIEYRGLLKSNNPEKLIAFLEKNGVKAILPVGEEELLCDKEMVPKAYALTQSLVSIPLYPSLSDEEQDVVIRVIHAYQDREGKI